MQVGVGFVSKNKITPITFPRLGAHDIHIQFLFIRILNDLSICYKKEILLQYCSTKFKN